MDDPDIPEVTWVGKSLNLKSKVILTLCKALFAYSDTAKAYFAG